MDEIIEAPNLTVSIINKKKCEKHHQVHARRALSLLNGTQLYLLQAEIYVQRLFFISPEFPCDIYRIREKMILVVLFLCFPRTERSEKTEQIDRRPWHIDPRAAFLMANLLALAYLQDWADATTRAANKEREISNYNVVEYSTRKPFIMPIPK